VSSGRLVELPPQPAGVAWPTEQWPEDALPDGVELGPLLDEVFDDDGPMATTFAVLVIQGGRVITERYHGALEYFDRPPTPVTAEVPLLSWSMAKSVLHATVGVLVGQERLELDAPAPVPEWSGQNDPRAAITLRQLLAMRDGLDWVEDYVDERVSDTITMLFGDGQPDMAHFAADRPLAAAPGTRFNYSSGTSNIVSGVVARTVGPGEDYARFLHTRLFTPIGMGSADPEFDEAGTWVGSSYLRATARDWARFGLLYLRDGVWEGNRILPAGWVDYARTMVSMDEPDDPDQRSPYGAHWWGMRGDTLETLDPLGTFRASGYEGQSITICPPLDLVVVRLGATAHEREDSLVPWRAAMVRAFAQAR
jgi:CubicO group peptidase (beta-lactamase class C family)